MIIASRLKRKLDLIFLSLSYLPLFFHFPVPPVRWQPQQAQRGDRGQCRPPGAKEEELKPPTMGHNLLCVRSSDCCVPVLCKHYPDLILSLCGCMTGCVICLRSFVVFFLLNKNDQNLYYCSALLLKSSVIFV